MSDSKKTIDTLRDPRPWPPDSAPDPFTSTVDGFSAKSPSEPDVQLDEQSFLSPPQAEGEIGRFRGYRIVRKIGEGGMGLVFEAEDIKLKRRVALKVMRPEIATRDGHRQRFVREAQTAAAVDHVHIVPIHQVGDENGALFIVMPFLKGESLEARLQRSFLGIQEVVKIGWQTAMGLAAAHQSGLIHRDIKPANI